MQDASAPKPPSLIKLGKLANSKSFDKLEEAWPDAVTNPDFPVDDLLALSGQVFRLGETARADTFACAVIEQVETRDGQEPALNAARHAVQQMPTDADGVKNHLHRLYQAVYADFEELPSLLELLAGDDQAAAAAKIDRYCQLRPGSFLVDYNWVEPGVVETVDPVTGVIVARFVDRRQEYGPATLEKAVPRENDYFPALVLYDPDRLVTLAGEDAVAFVKLAVKAELDGKLSYKNLKKHVINLLGDKGWTKWWKDSRETLRHDPMLSVGGGSQPSFRLRRQADRYEDRLRRQFNRLKDPVEQFKAIQSYLDETSRKSAKFEADADLLVHYGNSAAKAAVAALKDDQPAVALAGLAIHHRVAARGVDVAKPNPRAAVAVLGRIKDKGSLTADLPEGMLNLTLDYLRETQPDIWAEVWCAVLLRAGKRLSDHVARGLLDGDKSAELRATLGQALDRPTASPDLVIWMWRTRHGSGTVAKTLQDYVELTSRRCLMALLTMTNAVGHLHAVSGEERHLKVLESARADITCQKAEPLLTVIRESDRAELLKLRPLMVDNDGLNPALKSRLKLMLRAEHPSLFTEQTWPWEVEDVVYTTEMGLKKTQAALQHIVDEEIPAVAKQIGEAASHGDLSENSEYTAALEKRDQLFSRANSIEVDLKLAKVIDLDMAESDFVNIGTRVRAREIATDQEHTFTFLGPWDADSDQGILNYKAPLAMAFMGKKVGETVSFGEEEDLRQWEVLEVTPAVT